MKSPARITVVMETIFLCSGRKIYSISDAFPLVDPHVLRIPLNSFGCTKVEQFFFYVQIRSCWRVFHRVSFSSNRVLTITTLVSKRNLFPLRFPRRAKGNKWGRKCRRGRDRFISMGPTILAIKFQAELGKKKKISRCSISSPYTIHFIFEKKT